MGQGIQETTGKEVRYSLDRNGVVLDISEDIENLTGYKRDELIGQNFRLFISPDDEKAVFLHFQKALGGIFEPCEFSATTKTGQQIMLRSVCRLPGKDEGDASVDGVLTRV
jgi:PAS domain S-box-containing protein